MGEVSVTIAQILLDLGLSTGVDVLSKRAANPAIRGASRSYKVYALISPIGAAYNALRISAYSDAAQLIAQEAIIEIGSKPIAEALLQINNANYEVHRKAESYLLKPEYADGLNDGTLGRWLYGDLSFLQDSQTDLTELLASQASTSIARAARARDIATELAGYPEANAVRRYYNFNQTLTWVGQLNAQLGNLLWQPVPEIGLGKRVMSNASTYCGIFRRNDPEGYGCIIMADGTRYFGQARYGTPMGYGTFYFKDGRIYLGKVPMALHQLGALISPKRDWVYYGEHDGTTPDGLGRRVGVTNGIESVTGQWRDGKLKHSIPTRADVYGATGRKISDPAAASVRSQCEALAMEASCSTALIDSAVMTHLRHYL